MAAAAPVAKRPFVSEGKAVGPSLMEEKDGLRYMSGFGNEMATEALPRALPEGQNSPQVCPYGLYAEQLTGTAFTAPRARNLRSWLYRIRPTVGHSKMEETEVAGAFIADFSKAKADPSQMRWQPQPLPEGGKTTFINGINTMAGAGSPEAKNGLGIHLYACDASMENEAFVNADGDFLIVPQIGALRIVTELGTLSVRPHEIAVVQRQIRFKVEVEGPSRGYICEIYNGRFIIPDLGPIGANGSANPRDFLTPVAAYEDLDEEYTIITKFGGSFWRFKQDHSPFDVVAWHGNYAPFKYDLDKFACMNSVTVDHPDPSIYTVITCQSADPGTAICDFVIFPTRWMVMNHSFRPPYYHRNVMSEFMGMIHGKYDAKVGFVPGGCSLHSIGTPHGPDAKTFYAASRQELTPEWFDAGLAFMFETCCQLKLTQFARGAPFLEKDYIKCWEGLPKLFNPKVRDVTCPPPPGGNGDAAAAAAGGGAADNERAGSKRGRKAAAATSPAKRR